ncbi:hypothetical protein GCK72_011903 [Caenorhabditis remanei]|uniref:Uncharacterized protein n=1 Tax=Caenorhabditis remanei TaxID=31234 RepID=A0A6A5H9U2_CAERE|nr:hypothetical protein GCK72_011903 [Caenorhabditis remanei]KAF1763636.1 hypothetical protein GCK72_011903 [Caenorhabditis remanei]
MAYEYTKIADLAAYRKPAPHLYGKIVFLAKYGEQDLLLLRDETGSIFVFVTPIESDEPLRFEMNQIVRIHRAMVKRLPLKNVDAQVGKMGCSIVVWPPNGCQGKPSSVSSKTWTRSEGDQDRINELSALKWGSGTKMTTADDMADYMIEKKDTKKIRDTVDKIWAETHARFQMQLAKKTRGLFWTPQGAEVKAPQLEYEIVKSFFHPTQMTFKSFFQLVIVCPKCSEKKKVIKYTENGKAKWCPTCKESIQLVVGMRVPVDVLPNYTIVLTIPVKIIQTDALESCENDVIECFDRTADRETFGRVKKFQRSLQTFLNGCTLKNIEGIVVTKSVPLKACIIYVNDCLISFE